MRNLPSSQAATLTCRYILVSNHLPVKASRENEDADWNFELDIDALVVQAKACHPPLCRLDVLHTKHRVNCKSGRTQLRDVLSIAAFAGNQHSTVSHSMLTITLTTPDSRRFIHPHGRCWGPI